ncbi:MAG TPA: hypothetical protein VLL97_15430 [Acidobacteriota bacterium]|nr:hypothetical protein [Acidobacteriota bacterium]
MRLGVVGLWEDFAGEIAHLPDMLVVVELAATGQTILLLRGLEDQAILRQGLPLMAL